MNLPTQYQNCSSPPSHTPSPHPIKFNLDNKHLSCFISKQPPTKPTSNNTLLFHQRPQFKVTNNSLKKQPQLRKDVTSPYFDRHFNHKVLFTHYGQDQVYVDCQRTVDDSSEEKSLEDEGSKEQEQIVAQCIRVITEQTCDRASETEVYQNPEDSVKALAMQKYQQSYQMQMMKNQRTSPVKIKELEFQINLDTVARDGRTTIMLRNIPNKYTQEMILHEIDESGLYKRYDFFYLPIDYKNDCNVGYAFINLIHTKFIHFLYEEFNGKKWRRFNSQKICEVCYARLQGTGQLINHFRYSNILNNRNWKMKPLIYFNLDTCVEDKGF